MPNLILRLALHFIRKKNSRALSFTSIVSIVGISFGVAAFLVVITVLNSFQSEIKNLILSMNPNLIVFSSQGIEQVDSFQKELKTLIPEPILGMNAFIYSESIMSFKTHSSAVYIRAIPGTHSTSAAELQKYIYPKGALKSLDVESTAISPLRTTISVSDVSQLPHVILGQKLAQNLDVKQGDVVTLMTFDGNKKNSYSPRYNKLYISGIMNLGLSQYDNQYVLMNFADGLKFFGTKGWASGVEVKLKNPDHAFAIAQDLNTKIPYTAVSWQQIDSGLFDQIERDGTIIKLIVLIISFVAGFNIIVTLSLTVIDRAKQIALLRCLGAKKSKVIQVFICSGVILGILGSILGVGVGLLILKIFSGIRLGDLQEFYYLEKIPVQIDLQLIVIAFSTAIALSFLGAVYPAWKATQVSPLHGLRNNT